MGNTLTAAKVFTCLSVFGLVIVPLNAIPWIITGTVEAWISAKRLQKFLKLSERRHRIRHDLRVDADADAVCFHGVVSRHLSRFYCQPCKLLDGPQVPWAEGRPQHTSTVVLIPHQNFRLRLWHERRIGNCLGASVWQQPGGVFDKAGSVAIAFGSFRSKVARLL